MNKESREKYKETCKKKYGVDHQWRNEEIHQKGVDTQKRNHDGKLAFNTDVSRANREKTNRVRYGGEPLANADVRSKREQTMINKYGHEYSMRIPESWKQLEKTEYTDEMFKMLKSKNQDKAVAEWLDIYVIRYEVDEIFDFKLSEKHVYIDVASENEVPWDYYQEKSNIAKSRGYQYIVCFPWEDLDKILSPLLPKVSLDLSECTMLKVYPNIANEFLSKYDYRGQCGDEIFPVGLVNRGELVQVVVLGKPVYNNKHCIEMLRICNKPGYEVVEGLQAILRSITHDFELYDIVAYQDLSKLHSESLESLGMEFQYTTRPHKWWANEKARLDDDVLLRKGYSKLFEEELGEGVTNEEVMTKVGWHAIYDCGCNVFAI